MTITSRSRPNVHTIAMCPCRVMLRVQKQILCKPQLLEGTVSHSLIHYINISDYFLLFCLSSGTAKIEILRVLRTALSRSPVGFTLALSGVQNFIKGLQLGRHTVQTIRCNRKWNKKHSYRSETRSLECNSTFSHVGGLWIARSINSKRLNHQLNLKNQFKVKVTPLYGQNAGFQIAKPEVDSSSNSWDIAIYVRMTLTAVTRSNDRNVQDSLYRLKDDIMKLEHDMDNGRVQNQYNNLLRITPANFNFPKAALPFWPNQLYRRWRETVRSCRIIPWITSLSVFPPIRASLDTYK